MRRAASTASWCVAALFGIDGAGLDAGQTDHAAILARAVQVNAGIWANELKVIAGANQVSADHDSVTPVAGAGLAPSFALDVAALGGMYARKITLIGTEAGLGVRNAGGVGAGAGGLVVTARGRLETAARWRGRASNSPAQRTSTTAAAPFARPAWLASRSIRRS
jgi:filamentous hemagglutinin